MAVGWILAWNRFAFVAPVQHFTYIPQWMGLIVAELLATFRPFSDGAFANAVVLLKTGGRAGDGSLRHGRRS